MSPLTITFLPCNFLAMNTLRGFIAIAPTPQFDLAPARLCVSVGLARVSDGRAILCYWVYSGGGENPSFHSFFLLLHRVMMGCTVHTGEPVIILRLPDSVSLEQCVALFTVYQVVHRGWCAACWVMMSLVHCESLHGWHPSLHRGRYVTDWW